MFILSFWSTNSPLCGIRWRDSPQVWDFLILQSELNNSLHISPHSQQLHSWGILLSSCLVLAGIVGKRWFSGASQNAWKSVVIYLLPQLSTSSILLFSHHLSLVLGWWYYFFFFLTVDNNPCSTMWVKVGITT